MTVSKKVPPGGYALVVILGFGLGFAVVLELGLVLLWVVFGELEREVSE